jgi:hypothetical protein
VTASSHSNGSFLEIRLDKIVKSLVILRKECMQITENKDDNEKAELILQKLREVHKSTQEALRDLRVPENLVQLNTQFLPEMEKLLPDEVTDLYLRIKIEAVLYYTSHGFSQREISRRLKGESVLAINRLIRKYAEEKNQ